MNIYKQYMLELWSHKTVYGSMPYDHMWGHNDIYIYIYIYMYICVYIHIYIYIYRDMYVYIAMGYSCIIVNALIWSTLGSDPDGAWGEIFLFL